MAGPTTQEKDEQLPSIRLAQPSEIGNTSKTISQGCKYLTAGHT
jgi:hypothetical protein